MFPFQLEVNVDVACAPEVCTYLLVCSVHHPVSVPVLCRFVQGLHP